MMVAVSERNLALLGDLGFNLDLICRERFTLDGFRTMETDIIYAFLVSAGQHFLFSGLHEIQH